MVYDAEHFFDGFRADRDYALARGARPPPTRAPTGSRCATPTAAACPAHRRGGRRREARPSRRASASTRTTTATWRSPTRWPRVEAGCTQVQGTINGWGERCGNANLISIIPALQLKMGRRCVPDENLARLTELSRAVSEIANIRPRAHAPYVGHVGVRAQGRHARRRRREGRRQLRAHPARARRQPPPHRGLRAVRARQRAHARRRAGRRRAGQRAARCSSASRSWRARATSSRRPRGRSSCWSGAAQPGYVAAVRGAGRGRDLRAAPRQRDVRRGDGEAEGRRRDRAHRRRGRRARCTRSTAPFTRR